VAGHHDLAGQPDGPAGLARLHVRVGHYPGRFGRGLGDGGGPFGGQSVPMRPDRDSSRLGRRPYRPPPTGRGLRHRGIHRSGHVDQLRGRPAQRHH